MASPISAAETCGAELMSNTNGNSSDQLQTYSQESVMAAFDDLHEDVRNNRKLLELIDNYYVETLKMPDLQRRLNPRKNHQSNLSDDPSLILDNFLHHLSCLHTQQLLMRVTLQSLDNSINEKLDCINALKKVSAVFFTATATISAFLAAANAKSSKPEAVAVAAEASILFCELGRWVYMILERRESAVMKHKETIVAMVMGARTIIRHVSDIHVVARRLQLETKILSETVDDGGKLAAVQKSLQDLRGKALHYGQDLQWAKQLVLQTIIKLS